LSHLTTERLTSSDEIKTSFARPRPRLLRSGLKARLDRDQDLRTTTVPAGVSECVEVCARGVRDEQVDCRVTSSHAVHASQCGHVAGERDDEHGQQDDRLDQRQPIKPRHFGVQVGIVAQRPRAAAAAAVTQHHRPSGRRVHRLRQRSRRTSDLHLATRPRHFFDAFHKVPGLGLHHIAQFQRRSRKYPGDLLSSESTVLFSLPVFRQIFRLFSVCCSYGNPRVRLL